jgi:hypothetical protein
MFVLLNILINILRLSQLDRNEINYIQLLIVISTIKREERENKICLFSFFFIANI